MQEGEDKRVGAFKEIDFAYRRDTAIEAGKPLLVQVFWGLWILLDFALLAFVLFSLGTYLSSGMFVDKRLTARIGENTRVQAEAARASTASSLIIGNTLVFLNTESTYDFFAPVENENTDWAAIITYAFETGDGETPEARATIMPKSEGALLAFRVPSTSRPGVSDVLIKDIVFERLNPRELRGAGTSTIAEWVAAHQEFAISNEVHETVTVDGKELTRTKFVVTNSTPYAYWSPTFLVLIERSGTVVGVNTVTLRGLEVNERREVELQWYGSGPSVGEVRVLPVIDYLDPDVYMNKTGDLEEGRLFF